MSDEVTNDTTKTFMGKLGEQAENKNMDGGYFIDIFINFYDSIDLICLQEADSTRI